MQANRASLLPAAERRLRAGHEPHQLSENIDSAPASALLNDKLQQLRKLPTPLAPAEDGIATAKVSPLPGFSSLRCSNFGKLQAIRRLLRDGCEDHQVKPFVFTIGAKQELVSENSGLEGFIHAQERFEKRVGVQASHALFPHYVAYIERVLEGEALGRALLADVQGISQSSDALAVKHDRLLGIVREKTEEWRAAVLKLDGALWARHLRAYQLFPRTFNIPGFRDLYGVAVENGANSGKFFADLTEHDLKALRDHSFSVLRPMGVFPIGAVNAKGTAGGSPYSIIAHDVDPSHGSRKDVADALDRAFGTGMLTVFEVVPNHTSCDARLLQTNPSLYVHTRSQPDDMEGYYHYMHPEFGEFWIRHGGYTNLGTGERNYWVDT